VPHIIMVLSEVARLALLPWWHNGAMC
jgi:hypothetical protein